MWSYQATLARLERAAISLEKREARRRQWQQLYAGERLSVPKGLHLMYDAEGRAFVAWPWPRREGVGEQNARLYAWSSSKFVDDRGILDSFVRLADEERPEPFLAFARRYGPLELCAEHGLPVVHAPDVPRASSEEGRRSRPPWPCDSWLFVYESHKHWGVPVDLWRQYAMEVRAVLIAAASLHQDEPMPEDAWSVLELAPLRGFPRKRASGRPPYWHAWRGNVAGEREFLGMLISIWIDHARLMPTFEWTDTLPYIGLGGGGTHGAIIRQLVFAVAQVRGVAVCAGCGQPFVPRRRWKYCAACGKRAADREAQRRRRARLAAKK